MSQPVWKYVKNIGDQSPLDYGGCFIFIDTTGVYEAEMEVLVVDDETVEDDLLSYTAFRFSLDRCTYINGILSDNKFHPEHPAWWASSEEKRKEPQDSTYLSNIAKCCDWKEEDLIAAFCSADPLDRAQAYRALGEYHGYENLDSYPLTLNRKETEERYKDCQPT